MNRARRRLTSVIEQISMSERRIPYDEDDKGKFSLGRVKV